MSRSTEERIADVRRILEAARRLRGHEELIKVELAKATGLSPEGVHLALHEHLEVDATDEELASLVAAAGDAERVTVILSANVFVGALRAIALARAAAPEVMVRPSSREPFFARGLLHELADPAVTLTEQLDVAFVTRGELHVYGTDETIGTIRRRARPGVEVRGHGTGLGIALVGPKAGDGDDRAAAADLARDVVPFDQRGCLSPRIALVLGDRARALSFGEYLSAELAEWQVRVPRGELSDEERADAARYRGTLAFAGELFDAPEHAVGVADEVTLPPPGRHVHVVACATEADVARAVAPFARHVAAIGATPGLDILALAELVPRARRSALGCMQRPPLDGPVDRR